MEGIRTPVIRSYSDDDRGSSSPSASASPFDSGSVDDLNSVLSSNLGPSTSSHFNFDSAGARMDGGDDGLNGSIGSGDGDVAGVCADANADTDTDTDAFASSDWRGDVDLDVFIDDEGFEDLFVEQDVDGDNDRDHDHDLMDDGWDHRCTIDIEFGGQSRVLAGAGVGDELSLSVDVDCYRSWHEQADFQFGLPTPPVDDPSSTSGYLDFYPHAHHQPPRHDFGLRHDCGYDAPFLPTSSDESCSDDPYPSSYLLSPLSPVAKAFLSL